MITIPQCRAIVAMSLSAFSLIVVQQAVSPDDKVAVPLKDCTSMPAVPVPRPDNRSTWPEVSVEILGSVSSLKGHEWPRGRDWERNEDDVPLGMTTMEEPHDLVVRLPSGRTLRYLSKATIFGQYKGTVTDAEFLPHPGQLHFQDAIVLLEVVLNEWDAVPGDEAKQALAKWKADGDIAPFEFAKRRGSASIRGDSKVEISFQIRPGRDGWVLWIMVGATMDERRRLIGAPLLKTPATHPATRSQ